MANAAYVTHCYHNVCLITDAKPGSQQHSKAIVGIIATNDRTFAEGNLRLGEGWLVTAKRHVADSHASFFKWHYDFIRGSRDV